MTYVEAHFHEMWIMLFPSWQKKFEPREREFEPQKSLFFSWKISVFSHTKLILIVKFFAILFEGVEIKAVLKFILTKLRKFRF